MTSLTHKEAVDSMLALFKAAWDTTGFIALYPNVAGDIPTGTDGWARVNIIHSDEEQASLSGALNTTRFRRDGGLTVQIFTKSGEGLSNGHALTKIVQDAFEGQSTSDGIWFRNVRVNEVGPDGDWYQINVLVDFTYDEIK
jgi:hypothetical protein